MEKTRSLISRNVFIGARRTSIRMEHEAWDALGEICKRENRSIHEICTLIENRRSISNRTSAVRTFIIDYFRRATTETGHQKAGHGKAA